MEYIYSAMVLYSAGKDITEDAINAIPRLTQLRSKHWSLLSRELTSRRPSQAPLSLPRLLPPQPPQPPPLPQTPLQQLPTSPKRKLSVRKRPLPVSPLCSDERLVLS